MKLAIIVPTICRQSLLGTLLSLSEQSDKEFDTILVRDRDLPLEPILHNWFPYLIHLEGPKTGTWGGSARNVGIDYAVAQKYDWIGFVDDDDFLHTHYVRWLKQSVLDAPIDVLVFRCRGNFDHVPADYIIPEAWRQTLEVGAVGNTFAVKVKEGLPRYEECSLEDINFLRACKGAGFAVWFSNYLAYGVRMHLKEERTDFQLLKL
jgi:hypothetical protein